MSNVSAGNRVLVDREAELRIYDALPTRWRRLVDSLPIPQRLASIQEYRSQLGNEVGYDRVVEVFSQRFPGWTPPSSGAAQLATTSASLVRPTPRRCARGIIIVPTYEDLPPFDDEWSSDR